MKKIWLLAIFLIFAVFCSATAYTQDSSLALVSDNITANTWMMLLPSNTHTIKTGATYKLLDTGEYATDPETLNTDIGGTKATDKQDSAGKSPFFDGRWIFSGNRTFSQWSGGQWVSIVVDFKQKYQIAKVQLWSLVDTQCFTESFEVLTSDDGINFIGAGVFKNTAPREAMMFVRTDGYLQKTVEARYVQVRIHRLPEAYQQQLGELSVWAVKPGMDYKYEKIQAKPVDFTVQMVGSGAAKLDWSKDKSDVVAWRVYRSDRSAEDLQAASAPVATLPGNATNYLLYPIPPKSDTWISVSAIHNGSGEESPRTRPVKLTSPGVFDCDTFGDMLAVNHFPNGGGAHQARLNEQEWQIVAMDMLARTPFKLVRWWRQDELWVKEFYKRGIGLLVSSDPATANPLGIYGFSLGAEPDLNGITPESFLETLKAGYKSIKAADPHNVVTAPTSGTEQHSLEWLDGLYKTGAKDYFDFLDLHPYCKTSGGHEVPPGIPAGAPEALLSDIAKVKTIMAKYGDSDKPMIATELGYSTTIYGNPGGKITKEIQSQYIVRALVLCHVLGFKRVFWYSFFDEGTSIYDPEHNYGIVDYYMQAKPAYYSLITLGEQIGRGVLRGPVKGCVNPVYGYTYKVESEYVSVLWNGSGDCVANLSVSDKQVVVYDLLGRQHTAVPVNGVLKLRLSPGAVYVHSTRPITVKGFKPIAPKPEKQVSIAISKDIFVLNPGSSANLKIGVTNGLQEHISGYAELVDANGKVAAKKAFALNSSQKTQIAFKILPAKQAPALNYYNTRVVYNSDLDSAVHESRIWVRSLAKVPAGKVVVSKMGVPGLQSPFYVISNGVLEASVAADIGGRIVEIFDCKRAANQIRVDYNQLKGLRELQWAYTYWDTINGEFKNASYKPQIRANSLLLTAGGNNLEIAKTFVMEPGRSALNYNIGITNTGSDNKDVTYRCHPEYNVGGTADNTEDVVLIPTVKGLSKYPVWLGLGIRRHDAMSDGWWAVMDKKQKLVFGQKFDLSAIDDVSIWFGESYYNLELSGKRLVLTPGESRNVKTSFFLQSNVSPDWKRP